MKKARATWFNVYERKDGSRSLSLNQLTRKRAKHQAKLACIANGAKLLYRIRVRRKLQA